MSVNSSRAQSLSNHLFDAIRNNNVIQVRDCIERGVDLRLKSVLNSQAHFDDSDYVCPLALACCLCHEEIIVELLVAGADPNQISGSWSPPPFMYAAYVDGLTLSIIKNLILYRADVNLRDGDGATLLHYLARGAINDSSDNLLCAVKELLDNGASFYIQDNRSYTPLHCACIYGNIDLVKLFIENGFDVNFCDGSWHVAILEVAIESKRLDIFDFLLASGADRHLQPAALIAPCNFNDHAMLVRILATCNVDINTCMVTGDGRGKTIVHHACYDRRVNSRTLQLLLDHGGDVRAVSATGDTALHYVINNCDCSKLRQLLAYNPPLNIKNSRNQTPLINLMRASALSSRYQERSQAKVLSFKMIVAAGANANNVAFENELNDLFIKHPEATCLSDYEVSSMKSLKEMCRLVLHGTIHVPVDTNLCKLAIPKLLQEYLNFPEFDELVDEFLKLPRW